ncbi:MAG: non-homologous end-joining DNA ligase [Pseudomonadota bacterium]
MKVKKNKIQSTQANKNYPLSSPDKILYSEQRITKLDLANYYEQIQEWILPYITKRFLTIVRCPEGQQKKCFYQRHLKENGVENIYSIPSKTKSAKLEPYFYIKDKLGLLALVQLGVLEIHPWGCHVDAIEKPDLVTFDLDPGTELEWKKVIEAAFFVKENLAQLNLISFVKTTGGKGLHVVIPIKRQYSWEKIKIFAQTFVKYLEMLKPDLYISNMNKSKRKGKIFIDYLRNQRSATAIAPYSTRAKKNAPIATPLAWNELSVRIKSDSFTVKTLPKRLTQLKKDPWIDFFSLKQTLRLPKQ